MFNLVTVTEEFHLLFPPEYDIVYHCFGVNVFILRSNLFVPLAVKSQINC